MGPLPDALVLLLLLLAACFGSGKGSAPSVGAAVDPDTESRTSSGCGLPTDLAAGGVQRVLDAGGVGGGERGYYLSLPEGYDPDEPHALVIGFPGTDWVGEQIQPYLDLERYADGDVIFAYPDPLWRDFDGWGTYGGWVLGPNAAPADGMEDIIFTEALLDTLEAEFCIATDRVSTTGHSWGGDMAAVVGCYLGDRVTMAAPVAANRPYWFEPASGDFACVGDAAVWTWFGVADDHFTWQDYPGQFGDEQDAFWAEEHACGEEVTTIAAGAEDVCVAHAGCAAETRYCLYGPDTGHQAPDAYAAATMSWFLGM